MYALMIRYLNSRIFIKTNVKLIQNNCKLNFFLNALTLFRNSKQFYCSVHVYYMTIHF